MTNKIDIHTDRFSLMFGDCLERMAEIPTGGVDMVLTDPPYGMSLKPQRENGKFHGVTIENDDTLTWVTPFFRECYRVLPKNSAGMFFCSQHCVSEFISDGRLAGFDVKNILVWDKGHFGMGGNWRPVHELCLVLTKGRFVTKSNNLSNILRFKKVHHSKAKHPTQKPVDMLEHLICEPDYNPATVLDPFMGSGSTGVAALRTGRKFIGIELDRGYYSTAFDRTLEACLS